MNYDNFESADNAIASMSGQYLCGKPIIVQYAFKPGSKTERHGTVAERILAANRPNYSSGGIYNMMSTAAAFTNMYLQNNGQQIPNLPPVPMMGNQQNPGFLPPPPPTGQY